MIKCPNCSKEIYESAVRCKHCKTKLFGGNVIAEKQGVVKDEVKQGVESEQKIPEAIESEKKKLVALTLCCLLGLFSIHGIHRLYVGKYATAALMFLTFGGLFIWMGIDIIRILNGGFKDKKKRTLISGNSGLFTKIVTGLMIIVSLSVPIIFIFFLFIVPMYGGYMSVANG